MPVLPSDELCVAEIVWQVESGAEIAVNRLYFEHQHFTGDSYSWGDALQTVADHVVSSLTGHGSSLQNYLTDQCQLARVDVYKLGQADGKATDKRTHTVADGTFKGGSAARILPPIFAATIQLWAYKPAEFAQHPRRRRGRLFFPMLNTVQLGSDGMLTDAATADLTAGWAAVLNDLQGMHVSGESTTGGPDYMNVGVLSLKDNAFHQLEAVSVAKKPAIIRSRMNKLHFPQVTPATISHS